MASLFLLVSSQHAIGERRSLARPCRHRWSKIFKMVRCAVYPAVFALGLVFSWPSVFATWSGLVSIQGAQATSQLQSLLAEGSEALQHNDDKTAERAFRQALSLEPRSVEILNNL